MAKAVEIPSNEKDKLIQFKYTWISSVDAMILGAQSTVDKLHSLRHELIHEIDRLISKTSIWEIPGATTTHALIALVYTITSKVEGKDIHKIIQLSESFPYFGIEEISDSEAVEELGILKDYIKALEEIYQDLPSMLDQWDNLSKEAGKLKNTAEDELAKQEKSMAENTLTALEHDIDMLKKTRNLSRNTMRLVDKTIDELK